MQPVREALPYSYQSWIVVYILQDSTGKINIFLPDLTIFLPPPVYLPPPGNVPRPRPCFFRCPPSRTRRGRRPRRPASCSFAKGIFRAPARQPFSRGGKRLQKRRQKPMVFRIPFVRLQLRCKKVPQRIASAPTLAAADMARREQWSPSRLGDYQIAHLPPALLYLPPAGRVPRPRARFFRCPPSRTRRGRRPRRPASCSFAKGIFRAPARQPFSRGGKRLQKRRQKPMVFRIPFVRLQLRCKKVPQRIASAPTLAAADMARREQWSPSSTGECSAPPPAFLSLHSPSRTRRGRRPRRPVLLSAMLPVRRVPRPRARVTFGRSPKSDQKRCLKPQVSRLPARLGMV